LGWFHFIFSGIFAPTYLQTHYREKCLKSFIQDVHGMVLDVGCGAQINKKRFCIHDLEYIALDYEQILQQVDSQGRGGKPGSIKRPNINATAIHLPCKKESIDTIICTDVLEHLSDPFIALLEFAQALKPGGNLLISVPFLLGEHQVPYDYFRFTRFGLISLFEKSHLMLTELLPYQNNGVSLLLMITSFVFYDCLIPLKKIHPIIFVILYGFTIPINIMFNLLGVLCSKIPFATSNTLGFVLRARKEKK